MRAAALALGLAGCGASTPPSVIPSTASQLVTVITPTWTSTTAELRLWQRAGSDWRLAKGPWPAVIGSAGAAWGAGLHGAGAPRGRGGAIKTEGDAKSPAGVFALGRAYGYAHSASTALPYQAVDEHWKCVDDARSRHYNQIVDQRTVQIDWTSAEDMRPSQSFYAWVVEIAHNSARTPGAGSCIFLHVSNGPASPTVGCTAIDEPTLVELLGALSPSAVFVLLPREDYDALAPTWQLPR